jgi:hypothetical protein
LNLASAQTLLTGIIKPTTVTGTNGGIPWQRIKAG